MATQFAVLGPVRVWYDGHAVPVSGTQPQALLTVLLLEANRVVTLDRLTELMWDRPPKSATANLRTYASRLRAVLGAAAAAGRDGTQRLVATGSGYRLLVEPEESDIAVFTERTRLGLTALADDPGRAAPLLRSALSLWRGPVAENVPRTAGLAARLLGLEEARWLATEHLMHARLALGEHEQIVGELHNLIADQPTRERLWSQLVLALVRCGNPAAATAAFNRARDALRRELGVEPGPELAELHRRVLHRDPALRGPGTADPTATPPSGPAAASSPSVTRMPATSRSRSVPAPVPPPNPFLGRTHEVAQLVDRLGSLADGRAVAIHGPAGVGKSALAAQVARTLSETTRQECVWVDMRGTCADRAPVTVRQVMRRINVLRESVYASAERRVAHPASRASQLLIVLDGLMSESLVRPLLPALAPDAILITSRSMPTTLGSVVHVDLAPLAGYESRRLLTELCGAGRAEVEPTQLDRLARLCGDLPLALCIAGSRLARRPEWSIADFVAVLADERCRLGELRNGDLDVRKSFDISYRTLADSEDAADVRAARLFRDLGRVHARSADAADAAGILECNRALAVAALGRLADVRLIEPSGAGRYQIPELLRIFAAEQDGGEAKSGYRARRPGAPRHPSPSRLRTTPSRRSAGR